MRLHLLMVFKRGHPLRLRIGQAPQQKAVEQAEHRGVHADRQRECYHNGRGESRTPPQLPHRKTQIIDHGCLLRSGPDPAHSFLSAAIGSTRAALRAGSAAEIIATSNISTMTEQKTTGSMFETPNSSAFSRRVAGSATGTATARLMPASCSTSRTTSATTPRRSAPNAMRTPISRVRCAVAYASTP